MKISTLAVAGAMAVFSIAFPKSTEAETYEFWYAFTAGALAALCDLHTNGIISTSTVKTATNNFIGEYDPDIPNAAIKDAVEAIKGQDEFKSCPIVHY